MIKIYDNGEEFIKENSAFLDNNKYLSVFFYLDAPLIKNSDKANYVLKVENDNHKLLAIKLVPYNVIMFGDKECLEELLIFLKDSNYEFDGFMLPTEIGEYLIDISFKVIGKEYFKHIGMDFMEAKEYSEPSSKEVIHALESDIDEIYECMCHFIRDCGLNDEIKKENIKNNLDNYRMIKKDNKIISFAKISIDTDTSLRVSAVYTRDEYRGQGYADAVHRPAAERIVHEIFRLVRGGIVHRGGKIPRILPRPRHF